MDNIEYLNRGIDCPFDEDDFLDLADEGNVIAQYSLGLMHLETLNSADDFAKAVYWLESAAIQGHVNSQLALADAFYDGIYTEQDLQTAFRWYLRAACSGNAYAQSQVSYMYEYGEGVSPDKEQSIRFLKLAADNNCPESQYQLYVENLGSDEPSRVDIALNYLFSSAEAGYPDALFELAQFCRTGMFVDQDINSSITFLRQAAQDGHDPSRLLLATILLETNEEDDQAEAIDNLKAAADAEYAPAMNMLAELMEQGRFIKKDEIGALSLILRASMLNDTDAAYNRARLFLDGKIVACNFIEGMKWLELAAEADHASAQHKLGCAYKKGMYGLTKDLVLAEYWLSFSAKSSSSSMMELADLYLKSGNDEESTKRAIKYYKKALKAGNMHAGITLSQMYFDGDRVECNARKAIKYLKIVSQTNDIDVAKYACLTIGHIYNLGGKGIRKNPKEALRWYCESSDLGSEEGTAQLARMFAKGAGVKKNRLLATALQEKTDIDVEGVPSTKNLTPEAMLILDNLVHSLWKTKSTKRTISNFLMSNASRINPIKRSKAKQ